MTTPSYPGPDETPATEPTVPLPPTAPGYGSAPVPPVPPAPVPPAPVPPVAAPYATPYTPYAPYAAVAPSDGMAIGALVVGIIGLVGLCGYGLGAIISPVAIFLGRSSMKRIDASQGQLSGRGMAQAGFVMGIIGTVFFVLAVLLIGAFIALGVSGAFDEY